MLKCQNFILLIFMVSLVVSNNVQAQVMNNTRAKAKVYANVVKDYHAIKKEDGDFGKFDIQPNDDPPTLNLKDQKITNEISEAGYMINYQANFYVSDRSNTNFSITLPNSIALSDTSDRKKLQVKNWTNLMEPLDTENSEEGFKKIYIKATLDVQPYLYDSKGLYTGFYIVTFDFN